MTDWLPWGGVLMAGMLATTWLLLRALGATPAGQRPDLRTARRMLLATTLASLLLYCLYLVMGESWIWY